MKLDGRQGSRIAGKLVEASLKNDEALLKRSFVYIYHLLISSCLMLYHHDQ